MPRRKPPPRPAPRAATPSQRPGRPRLSHWRDDGTPKTRYRTQVEADKAAFTFRLERGADLASYQCEFCNGWHLGAQRED